ncbi:hypothetical protein MPSEU_000678500 [Mayamaea pseudoterrestris]|nr:hypothetical protein MPSEU_000678500 [Mayamaea pseudoterrestris]
MAGLPSACDSFLATFSDSDSTAITPTIKSPYATHPSSSNAALPSSSTAIMKNPYAKTAAKPNAFVGGAEKARQNARKKLKQPATRIVRPDERDKLDRDVLSKNMGAMERFFCALLRSSAAEFHASASDEGKAQVLWEAICKRVGLAVPSAPLPASFSSMDQHYNARATLVLEEARFSIAQSLQRYFGNRNKTPGAISPIVCHYAQANQHQITKLDFQSSRPFTKEQLFHIRPGGLFLLQARDGNKLMQDALLGVILSNNRGQVETKHMFSLHVHDSLRLPTPLDQSVWSITPLCTLVSESRCFCAMIAPAPVKFNALLIGGSRNQLQTPTHVRFDENGENVLKDSQMNSNMTQPTQNVSDKTGATAIAAPKGGQLSMDTFLKPSSDSQRDVMFKLPPLNPTQQKAATSFLDSKEGHIQIIQGPPGTGKTTLLSSIICQYIMKQQQADKPCRLMVCAPTNKAISVLATRFLKALHPDNCCISAIMVGDSDKLLMDERSAGAAAAASATSGGVIDAVALTRTFLYSWMQTVETEYRKVRNYFMPGSGRQQFHSVSAVAQSAKRLERRIQHALPNLSKEIIKLMTRVSTTIGKIAETGMADHDVVVLIERVLKELKEVPPDFVWRQLLGNANVIFCTLASAGGLVFRNTNRVDDLIVDEAAAATEPELCIPFHLMPNRLMIVGDPLQLPATVLSRKAVDLGLAKSLHERLMFECNYEHVMLDVQYRMNPEISSFPSARFYDGRIANGQNVVAQNYTTHCKLLDQRPYIFLHVAGMEEQAIGGSYRNDTEAKVVLDLLTQLESMAGGDPNWFSANQVRVITFYQAQVQLLKRTLMCRSWGGKIVVATVDSSQGTEADIVLVSFVRGRKDSDNAKLVNGRNSAGFLTDDRRMNVALTRARHQLICIGNVRTVGNVEGTLQMLTENAQSRQIMQSFPSRHDANVVSSQLDLFYGNSQPASKKVRYS